VSARSAEVDGSRSGKGSHSSSASGMQNTVRVDSDTVLLADDLGGLETFVTGSFFNFTTGMSFRFLTTRTVGGNFLVGALSNVMRAGMSLLVGPRWG
jgi:hypothetical protein